MAPFDLAATLGPVGFALVFGAIGFGFGAALEMAASATPGSWPASSTSGT